jgi:hypothetical protein
VISILNVTIVILLMIALIVLGFHIKNFSDRTKELEKKLEVFEPDPIVVELQKSILSLRGDLDSTYAMDLAKIFYDESKNSKVVTPEMLVALSYEESKFDSSAVSKKGALGLTQIMPNTGKMYIKDVRVNVRMCVLYLEELAKDGKVSMLMKYNAGNTGGGKGYAKRVLKGEKNLKEK